jgi:hypothetical protein
MGRHRSKAPRTGHSAPKSVMARQAGMVPVSDHALIRFLERVGGMDVESVRMSIQVGLARAASSARALGDMDYVIKMDGHLYVVRNDIITTVLNPEDGDGRRTQALGRAGQDAG